MFEDLPHAGLPKGQTEIIQRRGRRRLGGATLSSTNRHMPLLGGTLPRLIPQESDFEQDPVRDLFTHCGNQRVTVGGQTSLRSCVSTIFHRHDHILPFLPRPAKKKSDLRLEKQPFSKVEQDHKQAWMIGDGKRIPLHSPYISSSSSSSTSAREISLFRIILNATRNSVTSIDCQERFSKTKGTFCCVPSHYHQSLDPPSSGVLSIHAVLPVQRE